MLTLFAACVAVSPSGNVLAPRTPTHATPAAAPAPGPTAPGARPTDDGFDFDGEDRHDDGAAPDPTAKADPLALQAKMLGLTSVPKAAPAPAPAAAAAPAPAAPVWDPSFPLPEASFGVRVLAVLLDMQPPRAVLGLPDGREQVVTPGAMLPTEGLVVLAIGRDAVQMAKVTPSGFYARVDTQTVRALYPQSAPSAAP